MAVKAMTTAELRNLAEGSDPFLLGVRNLVDTCKYHHQALNAGIAVMPQSTQFFNVARAPGVCNLEKINQVAYPLWITALGIQAFGIAATGGVDVRVAIDHSQIVIEKDNRELAAFPSSMIGGGGGLRMQMSNAVAGGAIYQATNGLNNDFYVLATPIMIAPEQILRVILETDGTTTVAGIVEVTIMLRGVESRPVR